MRPPFGAAAAQPPLIINPASEGVWSPSGMEPLTGALQTLNFNPSILLPDSVAVFTAGGQIYALPTSLSPWCVRWRTDTFEAAGLAPPDPHWTLEDFQGACAALQKVVRAGKVPGLAAVLGSMLGGQYRMTDASEHATDFWEGSIFQAGLWEGFALGFGGTLVETGRFTLTGTGTLTGLSRLVQLAADYALPPAKVPTTIAEPRGPGRPVRDGVHALLGGWVSPGQGVGYARLPAFPARPVIPTVFTGSGLYAPLDRPPSTAAAIAPYPAAAAQFLVWTYGPQAQSVLAAQGSPPVLADPAAQAAFWNGPARQASAVGDAAHFVNYAAGWPTYPSDQIVANALAAAVETPGTLAAQMAGAENRWNAAAEAALTGKAMPSA